MYVTNIEETDKRKVLVHVDGGEDFPLYRGEVKKYGIAENSELSEDDYGYIMSEVLVKRGKERAMHILKGADKTEKQVREKLKKGNYPDTVINSVIKFLSDYNYINDYDYAKSYIKLYGKSQSERLIREKLRQKGIDREVIDIAAEELADKKAYNSNDIIIGILKKKKYNASNDDAKEKNRIISHLARKGFLYDDILDALRCYSAENDDN